MMKKTLMLTTLLVLYLLLPIAQATLLEDIWKGITESAAALSAYGGLVMSLDKAQFDSNDPDLRGDAFLLTVSLNGQGQSVYGQISADQINQKMADAERVTKGIKIEFDVEDQQCQYQVRNQYQYIYRVDYEKRDLWWAFDVDAFKTECQRRTDYLYFVSKGSLPVKTNCILKTKEAAYGSVGDSFEQFSAAVYVTVDGGSRAKGILSNRAGNTGTKVGNIAYAYWAGNLASGESCPRPVAQDIASVYSYSSRSWRLIDKGNYDTYRIFDQSGFDNCIQRYLNGYNTMQTCITDYNSMSSVAMNSKSFTSSGGTRATIQTTSSTSGKVLLDLSKMISFPVVVLKVSAIELGIYIPVSSPKIVSVDSAEFKTGNTGFITVNVMNDGDAAGSVGVRASCNHPFSMTGSTLTSYLPPGQRTTLSIPITGESATTTSGSCTVTAYDMNNPDRKDTKQVTVTVKPIILCTPGAERCYGNLAQYCTPSGSGWLTKEKCEYKCERVNNIPTCIEPVIVPPGPGLGPTPPGSLEACYAGVIMAKNLLDFTGISTWPGLIMCWLQFNMIIIIVSVIAGIIGALALLKVIPIPSILPALLFFAIALLGIFVSPWIAIIVIILGLVVLFVG